MNIVEVNKVCKSYEFKNEREFVLNNLSMSIPHGKIYCLLGASGCGKTTLISCILGAKKLDSGMIKVLHEKVSHKRLLSCINSIGYMPQETALPTAMSIKETLNFFANISQMDMMAFKERYEMLIKLLELESEDAMIEDLSGGEMRRVSFAVSLIHSPQLLILDEPTVGLDILIVQKIWKFLRESIELNTNLTVLMSTHYPHEAEKADICGLMRNGKLLISNSPHYILETLNAENLDEASLKMCYKREDVDFTDITESEQKCENLSSDLEDQTENFTSKRKILEASTLKALMIKKMLLTKNSKIIITAALFPPLYLFVLLVFTIGNRPQGLKIGILNEENIDCSMFLSSNISYDCESDGLSCLFLNLIPDNKLHKISYENSEKVLKDTRSDRIEGYLHIPSNFSREFLSIQNIFDILELENSHINVYLDQAAFYKREFSKATIASAYEDFIDEVIPKCNRKPELYKSNMIFKSYKDNESKINYENNQRSTMPAVYLLFIIASGINLMVFSFHQYKLEKVYDRILLCGVSIHQMIIIEIILSLIIALTHVLQTLVLKMILKEYINIEAYAAMSILIACISLVGSMNGLLIAALIDNYSAISSLCFASWMIYSIAGGAVFPFEGMDPYLKLISQYLPSGALYVTFNNVIFKGYGIAYSNVHNCILLLILWIIGFFGISYVYLIRKKYKSS